jgi:hypothetical protein
MIRLRHSLLDEIGSRQHPRLLPSSLTYSPTPFSMHKINHTAAWLDADVAGTKAGGCWNVQGFKFK